MLGADAAELAPPAAGREGEDEVRGVAGAIPGVGSSAAGDGGVVGPEHLAGDGRGGDDDDEGRAELDGHERAVAVGEAGEGAVRELARDVEEVADDGEWCGARWKTASFAVEELVQVGSEEDEEKGGRENEEEGGRHCCC